MVVLKSQFKKIAFIATVAAAFLCAAFLFLPSARREGAYAAVTSEQIANARALINEAELLNADDYGRDSWNAFYQSLSELKDALTICEQDPAPSFNELLFTNALADFHEKRSALGYDVGLLLKSLEYARSKNDASLFTESSWEAFLYARINAEKVYDGVVKGELDDYGNKLYNQRDIDNARKFLDGYTAALKGRSNVGAGFAIAGGIVLIGAIPCYFLIVRHNNGRKFKDDFFSSDFLSSDFLPDAPPDAYLPSFPRETLPPPRSPAPPSGDLFG